MSHKFQSVGWFVFIGLAVLICLPAGCGSGRQADAPPTMEPPTATPSSTRTQVPTPTPQTGLAEMFPGSEALGGWTLAGEMESYDRDSIFHLVDGQAEAFFAYGFAQAAVQSYQDGKGATLRLTIWQVATPEDAYGLFTTNVSGTPVDVGNGGDAALGQRLVFWQERYYVDLFAYPPQPDNQALQALAEATAARLPAGGEPPALMARLPAAGLVARSAIFFHEEISIQDRVWLGGENLLALGPETDGVLARYEVEHGQVQLLLVQYPRADVASAGLDALRNAPVDGLAASGVGGDLLGAVWGEVDEAAALALLSQVLDGE